MRILHCPTDTGGNAWTLSRAERKLGLDSTVMVYQRSHLNYPTDIDLHLDKGLRIWNEWKKWRFFVKALREYDIFHFNFGRSFFFYPYPILDFLDSCDLPILRKLGKKIIVTYQGTDARQKKFCRNNFSITFFNEPEFSGDSPYSEGDALKKKRIKKFSRYAHKTFALNPDLFYVLPQDAEFLPYACVDLTEWRPINRTKENRKLLILHPTTNRVVKGTKYILEAVNRLQGKYNNVEFILVENIPHDKVKELFEKADLVIDQLLAGWYGGTAVEAMTLSKPVVCYIRDDDLKFIPPQMREELPLINATPHNIYQVLSQLVEECDKLPLIGERSRAYVERWHDPNKIAQKVKDVYESLCRKT